MDVPLWLIATIVIVIIVVLALLGLLSGGINPFTILINRLMLGSTLCDQLSHSGCVDSYMPSLENTQSGIRYDQIGQRLRDPNNKDADINKARFGEACEYIGYKVFDDCLNYCNCKTS